MAQSTANQRVNSLTNGYFSLFSGKTLVILLAFFISSCTTDPDFLGGNLIPDKDRLGLELDTSFVISAYTKTSDTLLSGPISTATLGYVHDDIFGKTKAGFMMQFKMPVLNFSFGEGAVADSLVLTLKLKGYYGDKTNPLVVRAYELTDSLRADSLYNVLGSMDGRYSPEVLGETTYFGDSLLKIKLSGELANRLISLDSVTRSKHTNFVNAFKGLYIKAEDLGLNQKSMYYFDLTNTVNHLSIHYHNTEKDSLKVGFYNDSYTPRYNHFENDYTLASELRKIKFLNDTLNQDSVFYVQGLGGVYGLLKLEDITNWLDSMPVVINRAELIIERENSVLLPEDSILSSIAIYVPTSSSSGVKKIVDYASFPATFGGSFVKAKNHYSFNITLHLQQVLTGDVASKELVLESPNIYSEANRVILRSGNHRRKIRLALTYTKL